MKSNILGFIAAISLAQGAGAIAQSNVASRYAHWEQRLRERINDQLSYPQAANGVSGDVLVGFRVGPDGKPTDVVVRRSSGYDIFDRTAVRLVSRLGRLGTVPSANGGVDEIVLKLSYGDGASTAAGAIHVAKADRQEQLANEQRDRSLVTNLTRVAERR